MSDVQKLWGKGWLFRMLPRELKRRLIRRNLQLPSILDPRLTFKVAESKEEFSAAFRLVHNTFVMQRRIHPAPSGLYLTPFHALPMTKVLLALWQGRVVGTVSVTPDSQMGLPMSNTFDLTELRKSGDRIVECFAFAVKPEFTEEPDKVLYPMFKYLFHFCEGYLKADYLVIAVDPKLNEFYETVLLFAPLPHQKGQLQTYSNGLPIQASYLNVKTYRLDLAAQYINVPNSGNPLAYLSYSFGNMNYPEIESFKLTQPSMTPEILDYFFNKRTNIFAKMVPDKMALIAALYDADKYLKVLPDNESGKKALAVEREARFRIQLQARLVTADGRSVSTTIRDVSMSGFKASMPEPVEFGQAVHVSVAMGEFEIIDLKAIPVRSDERNDYGFLITLSHKTWKNFITLLAQENTQSFTGNENLAPRFIKVS